MEKVFGNFCDRLAFTVKSAPSFLSFPSAQLTFEPLVIYENKNSLPSPADVRRDFDAVIFSGSRCNVTEPHTWVADACRWIHQVVGPQSDSEGAAAAGGPRILPILGICFGHQLLAKALGGKVDFNPRGAEFGTFEACIKDEASADAARDPLASILPPRILVQEAHYQTVLELPPGAVSFFSSQRESNQMVRFSPLVYGVQFHPEYSRDYMEAIVPYVTLLQNSPEEKERFVASLKESTIEAVGVVPQFLSLAFAASRAGSAHL